LIPWTCKIGLSFTTAPGAGLGDLAADELRNEVRPIARIPEGETMISSNRRCAIRMLCLVAFLVVSGTFVFGQSGKRTWSFDQEPAGKLPNGFSSALTGRGTIGQWAVMKDASAPSPPNILAQTSADKTDYRFPLAIAEGTSYRDLALSVKFKTISGEVDQGAGLVFRLKDKDNYYVVRANALEDNYRLYHTVNGRRVQFAGADFKVTPNTWHEIKVEARGNKFKCYYDGQLKISAEDGTFNDAGTIGLWTKADSVIYFDDLVVEDLAGAKSSGLSGKLLAQKLVDELAAKHPELVRIGLHLTPPTGSENIVIASNVPAKVGQKSDPEDLQAMRTGRPVVLKEAGNIDVTLPFHDTSQRVIGAIGLTLKPEGNEPESGAVMRARKIAGELEDQVPSKAKLFEKAG
jgi:hypothetical protein